MAFERPLAIHVREITWETSVPNFMADMFELWNDSTGTSTVWEADTATDVDTTCYKVDSAAVNSGGTGYSVGDVLTVSGGTFQTACELLVTAVSSGVITAVQVQVRGTYSVVPSNPASVTGGLGSSATFNLTTSQGNGAGSFAFKLSRIGGSPDFEINFRNYYTTDSSRATPDLGYAYIGTNPDGSSDPILDPLDPSASANNFTGNGSTATLLHGTRAFYIGGAVNIDKMYMIVEFDTAIAVLFYDLTTNPPFQSRAFMVGQTYIPRWVDDADGNGGANSIRIDGHTVRGFAPTTGSNGWWTSSAHTYGATRGYSGQGVLAAGPWYQGTYGWIGTSGHFIKGVNRVAHVPCGPTGNYHPFGEEKYIKSLDLQEPFTIREYEGVDYFMHLNSAVAEARQVMHVVDGLDPFTVGVYT